MIYYLTVILQDGWGVSAIANANKCSKKGKDSLLLQHQAAVIEGITESKAKYRKIVQAGIAKWVNDFQKGNIEINSVDDLKKLIELTIDWTCQDNTVLSMTAQEVVGMSVALAQYSNQLHQTARELRERIEVAEAAEELAAIIWPE